MIFTSQASVGRPPVTVWEFIIDIEAHGEKWLTGGVSSLKKITAGKTDKGTVFSFQAQGQNRSFLITSFDSERSMTLTSKRAGVNVAHTYFIEPEGEGGGCVVKLSANCTLSGFRRIFTPLMGSSIKGLDASHPQRIKDAVEAL